MPASRLLLGLLAAAWLCIDLALLRTGQVLQGELPGPAAQWLVAAAGAQAALLVAWLAWGQGWWIARIAALGAFLLAITWALGDTPAVRLAATASLLGAMLVAGLMRCLGSRLVHDDEASLPVRAANFQYSLADLLTLATALAVSMPWWGRIAADWRVSQLPPGGWLASCTALGVLHLGGLTVGINSSSWQLRTALGGSLCAATLLLTLLGAPLWSLVSAGLLASYLGGLVIADAGFRLAGGTSNAAAGAGKAETAAALLAIADGEDEPAARAPVRSS